jgi:hypothetical protein
MAFIVASLCTLVLLLSEVYDERDHVDEGFAHYLGDSRRDCTVIRTFPGDKGVILDRMAINDGTIFCFLLVIIMVMRKCNNQSIVEILVQALKYLTYKQ